MTVAGRRLWPPIAAAAVAAFAVAGLGSLMTDLGPWYQSLRQPPWKPPDWLFGPAWTLIFALIAGSAALAWWRTRDRAVHAWIVALFGANAALNVFWSWLFFRAQRPDWALVEIVAFWLSIVVLIVYVAGIHRAAGWLLVPYLAWVTFAAVLNLYVVELNPAFGGG